MNKAYTIILVLVAVTVGAQDGADQTIEELFLGQQIELQIMRSQANSNDRDVKLLALDNIRTMAESGSVPDGVYDILNTLALEGTGRQVREGNVLVNNFPLVRMEAAEVLGDIGGERAVNSLIDILRNDPEPVVLAEAAFSLGEIGINDNNVVSGFLVQTLLVENASPTPDNNLAFAIILALENISASNGGLNDPNAINAILEVTERPYIRPVQLRAQQAIQNMIRHGA